MPYALQTPAASILADPAAALLVLLVVPIALVGRRWGMWPAVAAVAVAVALLAARNLLLDVDMDAVGYLTRATAFATVAVLAGDRGDREIAASSAEPEAAPESQAWLAERLLTEREYEVLTMMSAGGTNSEIAARLAISESTVKSHVQNILRKLEVRNRTQAVSWYLSA
jgi:DNA-binding NarL/FixJ family response regulator